MWSSISLTSSASSFDTIYRSFKYAIKSYNPSQLPILEHSRLGECILYICTLLKETSSSTRFHYNVQHFCSNLRNQTTIFLQFSCIIATFIHLGMQTSWYSSSFRSSRETKMHYLEISATQMRVLFNWYCTKTF